MRPISTCSLSSGLWFFLFISFMGFEEHLRMCDGPNSRRITAKPKANSIDDETRTFRSGQKAWVTIEANKAAAKVSRWP